MKALQLAWTITRQSFVDFVAINPFRHSAATAYYTIFSLPGIAIITVLVASSFYEQEAVRTELLNQITLVVGAKSAEQIEMVMNKAVFTSESLFMKLVGILTLIISATTVFSSLQQSMNTIWHIRPKPKKEIFKFVLNRLLSLAMVASIGFLLIVSLMADTLLAILKDFLSVLIADWSYYFIRLLNVGLSLTVVTLVFALIFRVLPDAEIKWKHVWKGALVTTALFAIGKFVIGYYLSTSSLGDAYGAAGSLVALLTWVYYSVLILLYGAQFTYTYNKVKGHDILPKAGAVGLKIEELEKEDQSLTNAKTHEKEI